MRCKKVLLVSISIIAILPSAVLAESLLVEAEGFDSHGGWSLDQQFMQTMGSPYLLAHGMGKPVADAETTVEFKSTGKFRMWVRTMDWVPGDWKSPGRFQVILDGVPVENEFGTLAGWQWQDGGTVDITNKSLRIKLHDLTGFEGRCDAILFSNDPGVEPVNFDAADPEVNRKWRNQLRGLPDTPPDGGRFDVIVVGGGIAGCGAALAAEERGLRVALVHDRKALGGNGSIEVRVTSSVLTAGTPTAVKKILENIRTEKVWDGRAQARRDRTVEAADGIKLFAPYQAYDLKMADGRIASVDAVSTVTGRALRLRSDLFIDCTGDGWIGYWAGAEYRYGRESHTEFGEAWEKHGDLWSPKKPDNHVMGTSLVWQSRDAEDKVSFPEVPWAMDVSKRSAAVKGGWNWEYSANDKHQVDDAEHIRDHLFRSIYGSFYNAKQQEKYARRELDWVPYIAGKRESRRLMGNYIYSMKDMVDGAVFDDAVVHEDRSIDVHFQKSLEGNPDDFRSGAIFRGVPRYYIPFRCLYSKDVDNLMMAGRCFSCSHIGLGGPRVMKTTGQMGVATGYAASLCIQHRTTPRGIYQNHIQELKEIIGEVVEPERRTKKIIGEVVEPERRTDVKIGVGGESRRASDNEKKYDIIGLPDELKGLSTVTISRGSTQAPAPGFLFTISEDSVVYLAVHDRGRYVPPKEWEKTDMKLKWARVETDTVYKRSFKQGEVVVPWHSGTLGSNYGVPNMAFVKNAKVEKAEE